MHYFSLSPKVSDILPDTVVANLESQPIEVGILKINHGGVLLRLYGEGDYNDVWFPLQSIQTDKILRENAQGILTINADDTLTLILSEEV